jgi:hypothetical protein
MLPQMQVRPEATCIWCICTWSRASKRCVRINIFCNLQCMRWDDQGSNKLPKPCLQVSSISGCYKGQTASDDRNTREEIERKREKNQGRRTPVPRQQSVKSLVTTRPAAGRISSEAQTLRRCRQKHRGRHIMPPVGGAREDNMPSKCF